MAILILTTQHIKSSFRHLKPGDIVPHKHLLTPAYRRFFAASDVLLQHQEQGVYLKAEGHMGYATHPAFKRHVSMSPVLGAEFGEPTGALSTFDIVDVDPYAALASKVFPAITEAVIAQENQAAAASIDVGIAPANNALLGG